MTFYAAWILTPLILLLLCLGLGLLIHQVKDEQSSLAQVITGGFALICVIGSFSVHLVITALMTGPLLLILAIYGFVKSKKQLKTLIRQRYELAVLLVGYLFAGLPVLAIGKASWPGWVQLDDTGTFLAMTNQIMTKGYVVPEPLISTFDRTISVNIGKGYPIGSLVPLGVTGQLSRVDLAWLYFPYLAFCVALVAALFYSIGKRFISNKWLAAAVAIAAAHASTFYAYALWGGIKEVSLVPILIYSLLALTVIVDEALKRGKNRKRTQRNVNIGFFILALATVFAMGGKSGFGLLLGQSALFALFYLIQKNRSKFTKKTLLPIAGLAILGVLLWRPVTSFFNKYLIPAIPDSGNLGRPVNMLQILGIWPSGDFRSDIYWVPNSYIALAIIAALVIVGIIRSIRGELPMIAVGLLSAFAIALYSETYNGVWLTGKAIAVASPFFLFAAFFGASQLINRSKLKVISFAAIAFLIIGVSTANYLAYRQVWLAPNEKVGELQKIGKKFKGEGPALMTDYSVLGARYFLRDLAAESASELRVNLVPMRDGKEVAKGLSADIDLFDNSEISRYNLLVLRHSATGSRPLFNYDLVYTGKYYDVWRKNQFGTEPIRSIPLGSNDDPSQAFTCSDISALTNGATGKIYAAVRDPNILISLADTELSSSFQKNPVNDRSVIPVNDGTIRKTFKVDRDGTFQWYLTGSYPGDLELFVDGKKLFTGSTFLEFNQFLDNYLFTTDLTAGEHQLELKYSRPYTHPGAGISQPMGPIYLTTKTASQTELISAEAGATSALCNKPLDWLAWVQR